MTWCWAIPASCLLVTRRSLAAGLMPWRFSTSMSYPGWLASGKFHVQIGSIDLTQAALFIIALLIVCVVVILIGLLFTVVSVRVKGVYFAMITLAISNALYMLVKATDFVKWTGADEGLHGVPFPAWMNPNAQPPGILYAVTGFFGGNVPGHAPHRQFSNRAGTSCHP